MTIPPLGIVKNITQVGIVVNDLDKALRGYADKLGVGPGACPHMRRRA